MTRNNPSGTPCVRRAFTLTEALVVFVSVIFIISVAVPVCGDSDENARKVKCAAQMRQFALAAFMYSADNGHMPYYGWAWDPSNGTTSDRQIWEKTAKAYWYNTLGVYMQTGIEVDFDTRTSDTTPDLRRCPSSIDSPGQQCYIGVVYGSYPEAPFYYEYSGSVTNLRNRNREVRIEDIDSPSEWIMFTDSAHSLVYTPNIWGLYMDADGDGIVDSNNGILSNNRLIYNGAQPKIHGGGMNVTLCDGHVEWLSYDEIWGWDADNRRMTHQYWRQGSE